MQLFRLVLASYCHLAFPACSQPSRYSVLETVEMHSPNLPKALGSGAEDPTVGA